MTIFFASPISIVSGAPRIGSTAPTRVGQRLAVGGGDRGDLEALVVERDALDPGLRLEVERRGAADALGGEVDREVERDMGDAGLERLGVAVDVDRVGAGQDRRDGARGGRWRGRVARPGRRPGAAPRRRR